MCEIRQTQVADNCRQNRQFIGNRAELAAERFQRKTLIPYETCNTTMMGFKFELDFASQQLSVRVGIDPLDNPTHRRGNCFRFRWRNPTAGGEAENDLFSQWHIARVTCYRKLDAIDHEVPISVLLGATPFWDRRLGMPDINAPPTGDSQDFHLATSGSFVDLF